MHNGAGPRNRMTGTDELSGTAKANIIVLLFVILSLVGLRLWLEHAASTVPYPYWLAVSERGMAVIYGDTIYVCDAAGNITERMTIPGHVLPCQLSWQGDSLLVADWKNDELHFFGSGGVTSLPLRGGPNIRGHLNAALDEKNSAIYVTDSEGSRIHAYDGSGSFIRSIGSFGLGAGSLASPKDLRLLNDTLYVGNVLRSGVDAFTTDGRFVETVVEPKGSSSSPLITDFDLTELRTVTIECNILFSDCVVASYGQYGNLLGSVPQETGDTSVGDIALSGSVVYVSDTLNRTITKLDADTLSSLGPASAELNAVGELDNARYRALKRYSFFSFVALGLSCLPAPFVYWQYRRTKL